MALERITRGSGEDYEDVLHERFKETIRNRLKEYSRKTYGGNLKKWLKFEENFDNIY